MKEKIINLIEAATLFKISPETLRRKAQVGEVPAYKPGKSWIFIYVDLISYIRSQYQVENNFYLTSENLNEDSSHILNKTKFPYLMPGSSKSQRKTEKEYEKLML